VKSHETDTFAETKQARRDSADGVSCFERVV